MASVAAPTEPYRCKVCHKPFDTRAAVVEHWRTEHPQKKVSPKPPKESAQKSPTQSTARNRRSPSRKRAPTQPRVNEVQLGLTLAYGLAGQAFSMFGPEPVSARQATGMAMALTAVPAGAALDRVAQRTPVYKPLKTIFGSAGVLTDLTPLAVPAIVGIYSYAPADAKKRMRPMTISVLGMILHQTFGDEPPQVPEDMTPVALPPWIRELVSGLLPED